MTLPMQSSEKMSLVPVIATLLQFNPKELSAVLKSDRQPVWGSKPAKEVKRFISVAKSSSTNSASTSSGNGLLTMQHSPSILPLSSSSSMPIAVHEQHIHMYTPPHVPTTAQHQQLCKNSDLSLSDKDLNEKLRTMDVLNVSLSNEDLPGATYSTELMSTSQSV